MHCGGWKCLAFFKDVIYLEQFGSKMQHAFIFGIHIDETRFFSLCDLGPCDPAEAKLLSMMNEATAEVSAKKAKRPSSGNASNAASNGDNSGMPPPPAPKKAKKEKKEKSEKSEGEGKKRKRSKADS